MYDRRASGILLHPTSLPGPGGVGDLGEAAYRFVDWLAEAKQRRWQIMPLGPTSYGDSPYAGLSALAGNPLLISLEKLVRDGLLDKAALDDPPDFPADRVDFGSVIPWKFAMLQRAFTQFSATTRDEQRAAFAAFCEQHAHWLDNYALFAAVKEAHNGAAWNQWDRPIAQRQAGAMAEWRSKLIDRVRFQQFLQWQFFSQWEDVKRYANGRDIQIIGDIPIFVAYDSADVWANPDLFYLDADGNPTVIAGVPPDYFSRTGQRWGNPLYRWDVLAKRGYDWWVERFRMSLTLVDIVRIDHFRGFAAYWEVPASEETAINGRWVPGPGAALFEAVRAQLGNFPIIAEDLGLITADVEALRVGQEFPGMAVLQFAWGGDAANIYLPHNHSRNLVIYTGTHDNDTTVGWWHALDDHTRNHVRQYLGVDDDNIAWAFIRAVLLSVADTAIIPMQDVLSLGTEARMNLPGRPMGNWGWRVQLEQLTSQPAQQLGRLTSLHGRERLAVDEHRDMV
jgi:4-alpha-glucanotransferase